MAKSEFITYSLDDEEIRDVVGYEGIYIISISGHLYRLKQINGQLHMKPIKGHLNKYGYIRVHLSKDGQAREFSLHCLVLQAFIGERPLEYVSNHKDANRINNHLANLEYVTQKQNVHHCMQLGRFPSGDAHYSRTHPEKLAHGDRNGSRQHPDSYPKKLTDEQVKEIRLRNESARSLAQRLGVTERHIHMIRKGQTRKSVK